jgi:hypothetical protein
MPVPALYGIAFDLSFVSSIAEPGSVSLSYPSSWLGDPGTNAIKVAYINETVGIADGAIVKTDHINSSGYGRIAELQFRVEPSLTGIADYEFGITDINAVDANGSPVTFNAIPDTIMITPYASTEEGILNELSFLVYPNPFGQSAEIRYQLKQGAAVKLKVTDVLGREVMTYANGFQAPGVYRYNFSPESGSVFIVLFEVDGVIYSHRLIKASK